METNRGVLKNRRFLVFLLGAVIAAVGSGMTSFGVGVYVFERTDSAFIKSMISLAAFLPTIVMGPFAGFLADRFDRRKLMILGDSLSTSGIFLILYAVRFAESNTILIGIGVFLSALFSTLIEPAAAATVSDILSKEDYINASGLLQLAGSARFLIAPVLSALVMAGGGLEAVLLIDLLTILSTVGAIIYISIGLKSKKRGNEEELQKQSLRHGFNVIKSNAGIRTLILFMIFLTFMLGSMQELCTPLILSFTDAKTLSLAITIAALGMVFSSLYLGMREIKGNKLNVFSLSAFVTGAAMVGFGARENIFLVTLFGCLFFSALPFMNSIADYWVRINIPNVLQGRVFGIINSVSQIGYLLAYALTGLLSDFVFRPLLREGGMLASSLGQIIGVGSGRGIGLLIISEGVVLMIAAASLPKNKALSRLKGTEAVYKDHFE